MPKQADSQIDTAVSQVIDLMKDRLGEPLTIDEMAVSARFSKFHFSRIFLTATGLSPARFLAAMRLGEAKRLLLCTHLTVTEIGVKVGYTSAGSFSSRFKFSVGMAPLAFRERRGVRPPSELPSPPPSSDCGTVHGRVTLPPEVCPGPVFLGLFPQPICEGTPVRCEVLAAPGEFLLDHVPSGRWHLLGYHNALTGRPRADHGGPPAPPLAAEDPPVPPARALTEPQWRGTVSSVELRAGDRTEVRTLALRRPRLSDPPVLSAPWENMIRPERPHWPEPGGLPVTMSPPYSRMLPSELGRPDAMTGIEPSGIKLERR